MRSLARRKTSTYINLKQINYGKSIIHTVQNKHEHIQDVLLQAKLRTKIRGMGYILRLLLGYDLAAPMPDPIQQ